MEPSNRRTAPEEGLGQEDKTLTLSLNDRDDRYCHSRSGTRFWNLGHKPYALSLMVRQASGGAQLDVARGRDPF